MPIEKITRDDALAQSANPVAENIAALKTLFPQAFAEGKIDFDTLRQLLGDAVDDGDERYGLNWSGKRAARRLALTPSMGTLRPAKLDSVDWDSTRNLMIEGDNLEVLKLLQKSYAGKVKLIYIDPPYNTGNDFVYPDDYKDSIGNYLRRTGQVDAEGVKNSSNAESSGRFHTDWLNMIYPRLVKARELLSDDGVIAISIDENELSRAILVCDEIFGEECLLGLVAVQLNPRGRHLDRFLARTHEYVCLYARDPDSNPTSRIAKDDRMTSEYRKEDNRGKYRELELRNRNPAFNSITRPNLFYPIFVDPISGTVSVVQTETHTEAVLPKNSEGVDSCWTWGKDKLARESDIVSGRAVSDGSYRIYRRDYLIGENGEVASTLPKALWVEKEINNDLGKRRVQDLFGQTVFSFPKAAALIQKLIEVGGASDALILDFFAGSGTTGDAVMAQNAADGGNRRYILVQLPEPLSPDNKDQKTAADFCDSLDKPRTIAELTKERLRRAGAKIKAEHPLFTGDTGFRAYKLASSNIRAWNPGEDLAADIEAHVNNLLPDRSTDDLLVELMLKTGLDLTTPMQTRMFGNKECQCFGGGVLFTFFSDVSEAEGESLAEGLALWYVELKPETPTTIFFRDTGFESNQAKLNLCAILEQRIARKDLRLRSL